MKKMSTKRNHRIDRFMVKKYHALAAFSTGGDGKCHVVHGRTGKKILANQMLVDALVNTPHRWNVTIAALYKKDGLNQMKTLGYKCPHDVYQHVLATGLTDIHAKLCEDVNPNLLCGSAWIADPTGSEIDDELAFDIFESLGGWSVDQLAVLI